MSYEHLPASPQPTSAADARVAWELFRSACTHRISLSDTREPPWLHPNDALRGFTRYWDYYYVTNQRNERSSQWSVVASLETLALLIVCTAYLSAVLFQKHLHLVTAIAAASSISVLVTLCVLSWYYRLRERPPLVTLDRVFVADNDLLTQFHAVVQKYDDQLKSEHRCFWLLLALYMASFLWAAVGWVILVKMAV